MVRRARCLLACSIISYILFGVCLAGVFVWPILFQTLFRQAVYSEISIESEQNLEFLRSNGRNSNLVVVNPCRLTTTFCDRGFTGVTRFSNDCLTVTKFLQNSKGYAMWNTTNFPDAPEIFEAYHFFNLTNPNEVLKGAKPVFKEIGPFVYKFNKDKIDIEWNDERTIVKYVEWIYFQFKPEMSIGNPEDFNITNLNPAYLGALAGTHGKGEAVLPIVFVSVELRWIMEFLNEVFIPDFLMERASTIISSVSSDIINTYMHEHNSTLEEAQEYFWDLWANSTVSSGNPTIDAMKLALHKQPTKIPLSSAKKLFNPVYPYSLVNSESNNITWSVVKYWSSLTKSNSSDVERWFGLTWDQVNAIVSWLKSSLFTDLRNKTVTSSFGVNTTQELACLQWGQGQLSDSISSLYNDRWPYAPEFYYFTKSLPLSPSNITVPQCMRMTDGETKITWAKEFGIFLEEVGHAAYSGNFTVTKQKWLIDKTGLAAEILAYIAYLTSYFSSEDLKNVLANNNGLIVTRPASQWLWDIPDGLSPLLLPDPPQTSFKHNASTPDIARKMYYPTAIYTGKDDVSKYGQYYQFRGYSWIDWLYPINYTVRGSNEDGLFPPFIKPGQRLGVFEEEYLRYMPLDPIADVEVKGIPAVRYSVVNATLQIPDPDLANYEPGFGNLTERYNGTPIFLSHPHFFGSPLSWSNKIEGVVQNLTTDLARIDVEPNTAIGLWKGLQINLYIANDSTWFNWYNPGIPKGIMYPVMIGYQYGIISDELVPIFTGKVGLALKLEVIVRWTFVGLTPFLFILGSLLLITWRKRRATYELIN